MDTNSEAFRLECEARTWIKMIKQNGHGWWTAQKIRLREIRGDANVDRLIKEMERLRQK